MTTTGGDVNTTASSMAKKQMEMETAILAALEEKGRIDATELQKKALMSLEVDVENKESKELFKKTLKALEEKKNKARLDETERMVCLISEEKEKGTPVSRPPLASDLLSTSGKDRGKRALVSSRSQRSSDVSEPGAHSIEGIADSSHSNAEEQKEEVTEEVNADDSPTPSVVPEETSTIPIAAEVARTDEEIEAQVRKRIFAEAVQASDVSADYGDSRDLNKKDPKVWWRRGGYFLLCVVLLVIVIAVPVAVTKKNNTDHSEVSITASFQLDQFPVETGWSLTCGDAELTTVAEGTYNVSFQYINETFKVKNGVECQINVTDQYGDGFCCRHGDGYFQVSYGNSASSAEDIILRKSGEFGSQSSANFTAAPPGPGNSSLAPTASFSTSNSTFWRQLGQDMDGQKNNDKLGYSVSLSRNASVVAVGAPGLFSEDSQGYVQVQRFDVADNSWTQLGQVLSGESFDLHSGSSISLSGDGTVLAVGGSGTAGFVRVYEFIADKNWWSPKGQKIVGVNDTFGTSVSLSSEGGILAIGVPRNDNQNGEHAGVVRIYKFSSTSFEWIQQGQDLNGVTDGDQFGFSVSISDNGLVVAAGAPSPGVERPGYAAVYQYDALTNEWVLIGMPFNMRTAFGDAATGENGDESGTSVSLSYDGSRLAVGYPHISDGAAGYARVFEYNSSSWNQIGRDLVDISEGAAESVSLSADGLVVAIGARTANDSVGRVRVFQQENMTCEYPSCWNQVGEDIVGESSGGSFGDAVSLSVDGSNTVLVVGAPFQNDAVGTVQVFVTS